MNNASSSLCERSQKLQAEFRQELIAIADWWVVHAQDQQQGGFFGEINANNQPVINASKGVILNARILWFFSEVALEIPTPAYRACAERAYQYLLQYFFDAEHGGVFWEVSAQGLPLSTKKQVYAQAFAIYALSAYYQLTGEKQALERALECFELIERHAIDRVHEGYLEAFSCSWEQLNDWRLSDKDLNFPKSQNNHLHILEAYTRLHSVYPSVEIRSALKYNIQLFDKYMIDKKTFHLRMFMDMQWGDYSPGFTFGHDIEAAWLIAKGLESLGDTAYSEILTPVLLNVAMTTLQEAIGTHGQVMDSYDFTTKSINADSVWWVQAEALVGFMYAYAVSAEDKYFLAGERVWEFIKTYQIDKKNGEWLWLSTINSEKPEGFYKVGFWKCPYHNGRAMIEASKYLQQVSKVAVLK
jgi:mannobiose 2-epimerase